MPRFFDCRSVTVAPKLLKDYPLTKDKFIFILPFCAEPISPVNFILFNHFSDEKARREFNPRRALNFRKKLERVPQGNLYGARRVLRRRARNSSEVNV